MFQGSLLGPAIANKNALFILVFKYALGMRTCNITVYYMTGTQKRAITPIDENKYPALLHSLTPG